MSDLITVKNSALSGQGLFLTRAVKKGEVVLRFQGITLQTADIDLSASNTLNYLQFDQSKYLDLKDHSVFGNHSCNPNCKVSVMANNVFLIAIRNIASNEELTYDYSSTSNESPDTFILQCNCQSFNCRKTISGFDTVDTKNQQIMLDKELVADYLKR